MSPSEPTLPLPIPADDPRVPLLDALAHYGRRFPDEEAVVAQFRAFVASHPRCLSRELAAGHLTASAFVVDASGKRTLLLHHRKLDRWLQPGGHADGESDLSAAALRECEEETGIQGLEVEPGIFDLDRHRIPERGHEAEHWHYDVRFLVRAPADASAAINDESRAMVWRDIAAVADDHALDASIRRMARKWLARAAT
jgi:8-oxo-dGTP pyrophosphatase MutT (NUDIX family)